MSYNATSQTSNDSVTCIPNAQLRLAVNKIELGKVCESELKLTQTKLDELLRIQHNQASIINELNRKDSLHKTLITDYKSIINNKDKTQANLEASILMQKMLLKKQKLKKWGALAVGILAGFLIGNQ